MNDVVESNHVMKIPIDKLVLGMFVTAIDRQQSKVDILNPGKIKHHDAIIKLKNSNVTTVWVDIERSSDNCGLFKSDKPNDSIKPLARKATVTRDARQLQAKNLLAEAKGLIQKVLAETYEGKAFDITQFDGLADKMIETVMDNEDAFKCILALRTKDCLVLK
ncbi:DUF3391 domain-containing protein [Shewanella polaris]|uniref:DUF3391 domain-containing protein n=1 Tax=Shewanella polaris TaxID=2588449 RepID=A0A4Y5YEI5_9GAMM|nr:DUF3391 domain-containing protein [Shewanella polaris]QDE31191.1 DUF3391 domain-containing protein [Shewanella polaris]